MIDIPYSISIINERMKRLAGRQLPLNLTGGYTLKPWLPSRWLSRYVLFNGVIDGC